MDKSRRKVFIALLLFVVALMLIRLAFATVKHDFSVGLMILGVASMIAAMIVFFIYFRE